MSPSVLYVEDDDDLREELVAYLADSGYRVHGVGSVAAAETALGGPTRFDLLVLDINLPDGNGFELCRRMRPHLRAGIIMCSGRSERELRIDCLKNGADAYLVKPVDPLELEATLTSVLRRVATAAFSPVLAAPLPMQWHLDCMRRTLHGPNGSVVGLSAGEYILLTGLFEEPGQQRSREAIIAALDAEGIALTGRQLEVVVSRLRRKVLDKSGLELPLKSAYGKGYAFTDHCKVMHPSGQ